MPTVRYSTPSLHAVPRSSPAAPVQSKSPSHHLMIQLSLPEDHLFGLVTFLLMSLDLLVTAHPIGGVVAGVEHWLLLATMIAFITQILFRFLRLLIGFRVEPGTITIQVPAPPLAPREVEKESWVVRGRLVVGTRADCLAIESWEYQYELLCRLRTVAAYDADGPPWSRFRRKEPCLSSDQLARCLGYVNATHYRVATGNPVRPLLDQ
jgi:hypothetical protein